MAEEVKALDEDLDITSDAHLQRLRDLGVPEQEAQFIMAMNRGEIDGDVIELPDPAEAEAPQA